MCTDNLPPLIENPSGLDLLLRRCIILISCLSADDICTRLTGDRERLRGDLLSDTADAGRNDLQQ